jgi:hypothetical protein
MLPLVQEALTNLTHGRSPYAEYRFPWPLPLTYLPGTWLAYAPAWLLGIDIRWTNVAAHVGSLGALLWAARARLGGFIPVAQLWAFFILSGAATLWDGTATMPVFWMVAVLATAAIGRRSRTAPWLVGVALATSQMMAFLLPLVVAVWVREYGARRALRVVIVSAAVAALLVGPWILWSPRSFFDGAVLWFSDEARYPREWWTYHGYKPIVGLGSLFWRAGFQALLKPLQALVVVVTTVAVVRAHRPRQSFRTVAGPYMLVLILFNPIVWPYYYQVAWWIALCGMATMYEPYVENPKGAGG